MQKKILILLVLVGAAGWEGLRFRAQNREIAALRTSLEALAQKTQEGPAQGPSAALALQALERLAAPASSPPEVAAAAKEPASAPRSAERPRTPEELRDEMEDRFARQPTDASWSGTAAQKARTRLSVAMPQGSSLRTVDCRAEGCRIETQHASREEHERFLKEVLMDPERQPWNGAFFSAGLDELPDGRLSAVLFLLREGQSLPSASGN